MMFLMAWQSSVAYVYVLSFYLFIRHDVTLLFKIQWMERT
jgi:hypothetical protein